MKEAATHQSHCPSRRPARGNWETTIPTALGLLCGTSYSGLAPWGLQGNLQGSTMGNLTMIEEGREVGNNQHMDLSKSNLYQQCPSSNNNQQLCSFAEPSLGSALNRELRRMQICLIWILKHCLEPVLPTPLTTMYRSSRQAIRKQQI